MKISVLGSCGLDDTLRELLVTFGIPLAPELECEKARKTREGGLPVVE